MNNKHLIDYKESPFSKVIANKSFIEKIIVIAERKCKTNLDTPISKRIKIELRTWKKFLNQEYIKVLTYNRLSEFCGLTNEQIIDGIKNIDEIEKPVIPLNFHSKEGVRLDVGVINEGRTRSRSIEYTNKDNQVLDIIRISARKVVGENFAPNERIDPRDQTVCLSFPPYFAKHFIKLGISSNKNNLKIGIPDYIKENKEFCKVWWQGNISEEASIYICVSETKGKHYVLPRIQINRVKTVALPCKFPKREKTYYCKDIPSEFLNELKFNILKLIEDEAEILSKFGVNLIPRFAKLYVNKKGQQTATYSIMIHKLSDLKLFYENVGFELDRHRKQFELLLFNRGARTKEEVKDIVIKFYELVPKYLRGNKKIKVNKWLNEEDKRKLLN